uniref:hypothetical protein n=1 Tax=Actinokineospora sp. CA-119265 TaxID=3239890 RepID=UPI003F494FEE
MPVTTDHQYAPGAPAGLAEVIERLPNPLRRRAAGGQRALAKADLDNKFVAERLHSEARQTLDEVLEAWRFDSSLRAALREQDVDVLAAAVSWHINQTIAAGRPEHPVPFVEPPSPRRPRSMAGHVVVIAVAVLLTFGISAWLIATGHPGLVGVIAAAGAGLAVLVTRTARTWPRPPDTPHPPA